MIRLDAIIRAFGPQALRLQLEESEKIDSEALNALRDKSAPNRAEAIRKWLQSYQVFQGIDGRARVAIASVVLKWADSRDLQQQDLTSVDAVVQAHSDLMGMCAKVSGTRTRGGAGRNFTSLASKALWLCYPASVPIFDSFAQRALWVISKLEESLVALPETAPEYKKFVHVWKVLYERYATTLNEIDLGGYPYRVRIFDKILWLIGEPRFGISRL